MVVKPANESGGYGMLIGSRFHASRAHEVQAGGDQSRSAQLHCAARAWHLDHADADRREGWSRGTSTCGRSSSPETASGRDHRWPDPGGAAQGLAGGELVAGRRQQGHVGGRWQPRAGRERDIERAARAASAGRQRMMLSRVAESLYWLGRYVERAENTARLVSVNAFLTLDLPPGVRPDWKPLIDIIGANEAFEEHLLGATTNAPWCASCSATATAMAARCSARWIRHGSHARTIRDVMPRSLWEVLNELHLFAGEQLKTGPRRAWPGSLPAADNARRTDIQWCRQRRHAPRPRLPLPAPRPVAGASRHDDAHPRRSHLRPRAAGHAGCEQAHGDIAVGQRAAKPQCPADLPRERAAARQPFGRARASCCSTKTSPVRTTTACPARPACWSRFRGPSRRCARPAARCARCGTGVVAQLAREPKALHEFIDQLQLDLIALHGAINTTYFASGLGASDADGPQDDEAA